MNSLASRRIPFFFAVDAWARRWTVLEFLEARNAGLLWNLDGRGPLSPPRKPPANFHFTPQIVPENVYLQGFRRIRRAQEDGESWLANLTYPAQLETNLDLDTLARCASAPFRLLDPDHLAIFSPERFISITADGFVSSFPMKGTIDASLPNAAETILSDAKESAEHITIVDLIRNDLGRICRRVDVPRFRFITQAGPPERRLLQVSSEVRGTLPEDWRGRLGSLLGELLPAGSVTGAPKVRTCEVIQEAEGYDRGWYTGVFGIFDGSTLDSAVAIRFVEKTSEGHLVYKSGGGITINSLGESEYEELKAKIYAPFG